MFRSRSRQSDAGAESAEAEDVWAVSEWTHEGRPMLVRLNLGLQRIAGDSRYPVRVAFAVQCNRPDARGFPCASDAEALGHFEDQFVDLFSGGFGRFAVASTTGGMREFVFYATNERDCRTRFREWARTPKSHRVQMAIERDPNWVVYHQLAARPDDGSA